MSTFSDILNARMIITLVVVVGGGAAAFLMLNNLGEQRSPLKEAIGLSPSQVRQTQAVSADYSRFKDPAVRAVHQIFDQLQPQMKVKAEVDAVAQLVSQADTLDPLRDGAEINNIKAILSDDLAVVQVACLVVPVTGPDGGFVVDQVDERSVRVHARCVDGQSNAVPVMQNLATMSISPIVPAAAYKQAIAPSLAAGAILGAKRAGQIGVEWSLARR